MNSVRLYYIKHQGGDDLAQLDAGQINSFLSDLSLQKKASIQRLLHHQDRVTSILGLYLLRLCAQEMQVDKFELSDVHYPDQGKPVWKQHRAFFDFNVSHSGNMVMLAASTDLTVGVDVEALRPLKRLAFKKMMTSEELDAIHQQPTHFFDLWSKKEAVVKAANTPGLSRMRDVHLNNAVALLDDKAWFLKEVDVDVHYAVHLATSIKIDELIVKQIPLKKIIL